MFNAMALIHYEEMIERGRLPAKLNDMPDYGPVARAALRGAGKRARTTRKTQKPRKQ
jgi:hypothetical protein